MDDNDLIYLYTEDADDGQYYTLREAEDIFTTELLRRFAAATRIRVEWDEGCPACRSEVMLSYQLTGHDFKDPPESTSEYCGRWCPNCNFSGASYRERVE